MRTAFFKDYIEFCRNYDVLLLKAKEKVLAFRSLRVFGTSYTMFPPYELKEEIQYSLVRVKTYLTDTGSHFWLIKLYCYKVYANTKELFYMFVCAALSGYFGLRVLFGRQKFYAEV